jgi:TM2 domain-containing membrane protein YozV
MVAAAAAATPPLPYDAGTMRGATPVQTAAPRTATGKNPVVAAILSALVVGVGQFYNGDVKKGAAMLIGAVLLGVATGGLLWLALAIWSAVDAYQVANGAGKMR